VITLTVTASCLRCDWTAGPVPSAGWATVERAAGKHLAPGHPVVTMAVPPAALAGPAGQDGRRPSPAVTGGEAGGRRQDGRH
jgi:hypothetical protein